MAAVLCVIAAGAAVSFSLIDNYDIWRNLAVGRWIDEQGAFPRDEPFSFTESGRRWTDYEWLSESIFFRVYRAASFGGLVGYKALMVWLLSVLLLLDFRNRGGGALTIFPLALVPALALSEFRLFVRPHIHSLLLASVLVWWLGKRRPYQPIGVFLLFVLWANLHGGHMGLLLVALAIACGLVRRRRLGLAAAAFLGFVVNPYTWRITLPLVEVLGAQTSEKLLVAEWAAPQPGQMRWLWVYAGVSAVLLLVNHRSRRLWDAAIILVFTILTVKAVRMAPYLFLLTSPGNAEAVWLLVRKVPKKVLYSASAVASALAVGCLFVARLPLAVGVKTRLYPEAAASYVLDNSLNVRCFNDMHQGAYLIWRWYPHLRVYMDGRTELFADLAATERTARQTVESWKAYLDGLGITAAIVDYPKLWRGSETATPYPLFRFLGWPVVAWDDGGVLLLCPGGSRDSLIAKDAYAVLDPFVMDPSPEQLPAGDRERFALEMRRALGDRPNSVRALYIAGNAQVRSNRPALALTSYETIESIDPHDQDIHARKALALEKLGRVEEARSEWRLQLSRGLDRPLVQYHLGRLSLLLGDDAAAVRWLEKAVRAKEAQAPWKTLLGAARSPAAEKIRQQFALSERSAKASDRRGLVLMNQGKWMEAEAMLRQATAQAPWLAGPHQNLGACLANQEHWQEAELELQEALLLDPSLGWARYNLSGLLATGRGDTASAVRELTALLSSETDSTLRSMAEALLQELKP